MSRLQHRLIAGATYFVTTDAWQKRSVFHVKEIAKVVVSRIVFCRDQGFYQLHEFVLMPDHLHLLLTPSAEYSLERVMQLIKGGSSREIHLKRGGAFQIWQSGFHESSIRDARDFCERQRYIRNNPVVERLASRFEEWAFGSGNLALRMDVPPARFSSGAEAPSDVLRPNVGAEAPTPATKLSVRSGA